MIRKYSMLSRHSILGMLAGAIAATFCAYTTNEGYASYTGLGSNKRAIIEQVKTATFAAGVGTIAKYTPLAYNTSTNKWVVWAAPIADSWTIHGTATGATFTLTLTIGGIAVTTGTIAYNASAATVLAALVALAEVDVGDFTATGGPIKDTGDVVIATTTTGQFANKAAALTLTDSTTGGVTTLAHTTTFNGTNGVTSVKGFSNDAIVLDVANDQIGPIILEGEISYKDIVVPAGQDENALKAELAANARNLGLYIRDLVNVR